MYLLTDPEAPRARLLADARFVSDYDVEWSIHGDRIVARRWEQSNEGLAPLCVVDVTSADVTVLRDQEGRAIRGQGAQWADDDRRLVYWRPGESSRGEVWRYVFATKDNYRLLPPG